MTKREKVSPHSGGMENIRTEDERHAYHNFFFFFFFAFIDVCESNGVYKNAKGIA